MTDGLFGIPGCESRERNVALLPTTRCGNRRLGHRRKQLLWGRTPEGVHSHDIGAIFEPYVVEVDKLTGYLEIARALKPGDMSQNERRSAPGTARKKTESNQQAARGARQHGHSHFLFGVETRPNPAN